MEQEMFSMPEIEERPFPPFLPPKAVVMMMGTFPPKAEKRTMEFHYPNFQNDMWRVHGLIFFDDPQHFQKKVTGRISLLDIFKKVRTNEDSFFSTCWCNAPF